MHVFICEGILLMTVFYTRCKCTERKRGDGNRRQLQGPTSVYNWLLLFDCRKSNCSIQNITKAKQITSVSTARIQGMCAKIIPLKVPR